MGGRHQRAKLRLAAAGLSWPLVMTAEDAHAGKPGPTGYFLAATRLGLGPGHCLVVEDSEAGVRAGKAAGAVVAALKGVPADVEIGNLGELVELLWGEKR